MLLPEQLNLMAESFPDQTAYAVVGVGSMTFREWNERSNALAHSLIDAGIKPDDRVAIHIDPANALRWLVSYAGIHRAGGVAVPLNPRLARAEVAHMLSHSRARAVVADGALVAQDLEVGTSGNGHVSVLIDASAAEASAANASAVGADESDVATESESAAMSHGSSARLILWDEILKADNSGIQVPRTDDDLADILYTSGTTGRPKGVAVRHSNASMVPVMDPMWSGDRWLHASPMFTFAGLAFVYTPMKLGLQAVYQPRFDAGKWIEVVREQKPVAVFLVPAMAHLLLDHPDFEKADLSSIVICSIGSAPLAPFVVEQLQERMPDALVSNNYGMTEAGSAYCLMPKGEAVKRPGSVGQIAPPAEVRIVDAEGVELPANEIGDVRMKLPGRQREYFGDPEATAETWVDGWLITGDVGKLDDDGYLYIVGRSKDVIIRGGNNVHAADVEHALIGHEAIAEVAVVGVPHGVLGEDVVACVVLHPGAKVDGETLREYALGLLADYKVPRQWYFFDELPRNATGKVVKPELVRRLAALEQEAGAVAGDGDGAVAGDGDGAGDGAVAGDGDGAGSSK